MHYTSITTESASTNLDDLTTNLGCLTAPRLQTCKIWYRIPRKLTQWLNTCVSEYRKGIVKIPKRIKMVHTGCSPTQSTLEFRPGRMGSECVGSGPRSALFALFQAYT